MYTSNVNVKAMVANATLYRCLGMGTQTCPENASSQRLTSSKMVEIIRQQLGEDFHIVIKHIHSQSFENNGNMDHFLPPVVGIGVLAWFSMGSHRVLCRKVGVYRSNIQRVLY